MDISEAERILAELLSADCLRTFKHCRERMGQRGVTVDDAMHAMLTGKVVNVRMNPRTGN